jgi:biotin transporter BioY
MVGAFLLSIPLWVAAFFLYGRLRPRGDSSQDRFLRWFDRVVAILLVVVCGGTALYVWSAMSRGPDRAWWFIGTLVYLFFLIPIVLLAAVCVRAVLFKHRRMGKN